MTRKKTRLGSDPLGDAPASPTTRKRRRPAPDEEPPSGAIGRLLDNYQQPREGRAPVPASSGLEARPDPGKKKPAPAKPPTKAPAKSSAKKQAKVPAKARATKTASASAPAPAPPPEARSPLVVDRPVELAAAALPPHLALAAGQLAPLLDAPRLSWDQLGQALETLVGQAMKAPSWRLQRSPGGPETTREAAAFTAWALQSALDHAWSSKARTQTLTLLLEAMAGDVLRLRLFGPPEKALAARRPHAQGEDGLSRLGRELAACGGYLWIITGNIPEVRMVFSVAGPGGPQQGGDLE